MADFPNEQLWPHGDSESPSETFINPNHVYHDDDLFDESFRDVPSIQPGQAQSLSLNYDIPRSLGANMQEPSSAQRLNPFEQPSTEQVHHPPNFSNSSSRLNESGHTMLSGANSTYHARMQEQAARVQQHRRDLQNRFSYYRPPAENMLPDTTMVTATPMQDLGGIRSTIPPRTSLWMGGLQSLSPELSRSPFIGSSERTSQLAPVVSFTGNTQLQPTSSYNSTTSDQLLHDTSLTDYQPVNWSESFCSAMTSTTNIPDKGYLGGAESDDDYISAKGQRGDRSNGERRLCIEPKCNKFVPKRSNEERCTRCHAKHTKVMTAHRMVEVDATMTFEIARNEIYPVQLPLQPRVLSLEERMRYRNDFLANTTPEAIQHWHQRLLDALNAKYAITSEASDALGRSETQHRAYLANQQSYTHKFFDQGKQYNDRKINARLKLLFETAMAVHNGGRLVYDEGGDNSGYNVDRTLMFGERLERMVDMLQLDKRTCMDIIEGRGVNAFVKDPHAYEKRKQDNVSSNSKKAMQRAAAAKAATGQADHAQELGTPKNLTSPLQGLAGMNIDASQDWHGEPVLVPDPPRNAKRKRTSGTQRPRRKIDVRQTVAQRVRTPVSVVPDHMDASGRLLRAMGTDAVLPDQLGHGMHSNTEHLSPQMNEPSAEMHFEDAHLSSDAYARDLMVEDDHFGTIDFLTKDHDL